MPKNYYGSLCLTDLIAKAKEGHPSFSRAKNDKIYVDVNLWINDQKDKYGNDASVKVSDKGEHKGFYIGNLKASETSRELTEDEAKQLDEGLENVPF